jgi:DNA polymerase-3 subunit beta
MKFTVSRTAILDALAKGLSIVSNNPSLPILQNVRLQAENGRLWLVTTDMEVTVRAEMDADVSQPGATTLPAKKLFSIFKELTAAEVEIEIDDRYAATLRSGTSNFRLNGMGPEEFPAAPQFDPARSFSLDQGTFKNMLRKTAYAASTDESRHILNGNLLSFTDNRLTVVATDGRRLAMIEGDVEVPAEAQADIVVPTKTVNELIRVLGDEGPLKIRASPNQVAFELPDLQVVSKLIEGKFPVFRQVIPQSSNERVEIEREAFLATVRRAALMTSDHARVIKLAFTRDRLEIIASAQDVGEARERLGLKYGGRDITISFDPVFLMDCLRSLNQNSVYLEFSDELSPGVVKCDEPFLYVIMPMRTS